MPRPVSISRQEITDLLRCVQWDNPNSMRDKARIIADRENVTPADILTLVIGQDDWGIVHQLAQYGARSKLPPAAMRYHSAIYIYIYIISDSITPI